jgi:hypothetical protein
MQNNSENLENAEKFRNFRKIPKKSELKAALF